MRSFALVALVCVLASACSLFEPSRHRLNDDVARSVTETNIDSITRSALVSPQTAIALAERATPNRTGTITHASVAFVDGEDYARVAYTHTSINGIDGAGACEIPVEWIRETGP